MECLFCNIAAGKIPGNLLYEDKEIVAFHDIHPVAPVHLLIIPRKHIVSVNELTAENDVLVGKIVRVAQKLAVKFALADKGYRLVNNQGKDGGQTIFHLHFHLLGGKMLAWPPC